MQMQWPVSPLVEELHWKVHFQTFPAKLRPEIPFLMFKCTEFQIKQLTESPLCYLSTTFFFFGGKLNCCINLVKQFPQNKYQLRQSMAQIPKRKSFENREKHLQNAAFIRNLKPQRTKRVLAQNHRCNPTSKFQGCSNMSSGWVRNIKSCTSYIQRTQQK